jgi:Leucine-rich repeat (LRR) protein
MFIVKDRRKIAEILFDPADSRSMLKLSKRKHELQGCLDILCSDIAVGQLGNLKMLNLYENEIESLQNIGKLAPPSTSLEDLNLGNNLIKEIPDEFATLKSLKKLWIDDNYLEEFPITLCNLTALTELRLSGNQMTMIPPSIESLSQLTTLSLDNNRIEDFPMGILKLRFLEHLWLRQNKIAVLPDAISTMTTLKTLSISTNKLVTLPDTIVSLTALEYLYANANMIDDTQHDILNALCSLPKNQKNEFCK